ncbi:MAG: DMT family transporter [Sulfitobacter sp.]
MQSMLFAILIVSAAGICVAVQSPMNAALGRGIGSGVVAAAVSFGIGFLVLLGLSVLMGQAAAFSRVTTMPPLLLLGGALGAFFVWSMLWAVPTLGALTAITALILGQMAAALMIDATGLFGMTVQAITPTRLAAAALVGAGLVLSRV